MVDEDAPEEPHGQDTIEPLEGSEEWFSWGEHHERRRGSPGFPARGILTTNGAGCLSSDGKVLTVSVSSADPSYLGSGQLGVDYIQLSRGDSKEPFSGEDTGAFGGSAEPVTCTSSLLNLPSSHD